MVATAFAPVVAVVAIAYAIVEVVSVLNSFGKVAHSE